jgi:hypothetical protein
VVKPVQVRRAESRFAGWIAPLWILAIAGILFIPTEYRGGANAPHSHALLQLLLDAQDGHLAHTHSYLIFSQYDADWLDPEVHSTAASQGQTPPDVGQQQERVSTVSIVTFLVLLPTILTIACGLPRIVPASRRLVGRALRVLSPPPRAFAAAA